MRRPLAAGSRLGPGRWLFFSYIILRSLILDLNPPAPSQVRQADNLTISDNPLVAPVSCFYTRCTAASENPLTDNMNLFAKTHKTSRETDRTILKRYHQSTIYHIITLHPRALVELAPSH